jgi:hypothetical protein
MPDDLLNVITAVEAVATVALSIMLYRWVRARAILALVGAFGWGALLRIAIVFDVPVIGEHSAPLNVVTWGLFVAAMAGLLVALRRFNLRVGAAGEPKPHTVTKMISDAAGAARAAADHAATAAGEARIARERAAEAARLAKIAALAAQAAAKASGVADAAEKQAKSE